MSAKPRAGFRRTIYTLVIGCFLQSAAGQVVSVAPIITQTPTADQDTRSAGAMPPTSATRVDPNATFYIELWASNVGAPLDGLACVYVDMAYERTDLIDAIPPGANSLLMPIDVTGAVFNDPVGVIDEVGGCQTAPPIETLGVGEWAMVERIEMFANGPGGPINVSLADAGNVFAGTAILGQMNNVDPADIDFQSRSFSIGECGVNADCDDGNDCTDDVCIGTTCTHSEVTGPCEDGDLCTVNSFCTAGVCGGGVPVDCSALDSTCTVGACDPADGACVAQPANEGGACDDAVPCTENDVCSAGACVGSPVDCSSLDSTCSLGVCNAGSGICEIQPINEGAACDDANPATIDDVCVAGVCTGTVRVVEIAPVITQTPSPDARVPGPLPPASAAVIDPGTTFYIELWATNDADPLDGLACVYVDLTYDRTDLVDSIAPAQISPLFPINIVGESFNDASGAVDAIGGCQTIPPIDFLGVGEWVMVRRIEMVGVGLGGPITVSLADADNVFVGTSIIGQLDNVQPTEINFHTQQFKVGNCQEFEYGDVNYDGVIDIFDIFCVLDGFQGNFPTCTFDAVDLVPCDPGPGSVIDILDIFAVLDAFQSAPSPCPNPCIPP